MSTIEDSDSKRKHEFNDGASNKSARVDTLLIDKLTSFLSKHPKQLKTVAYGTAGFRYNLDLPLDPIFVRMGLLAVFRSASVGYKATGVMITASHNPECDNGVKMVDYDGGMFHQSWEAKAEALANASEESLPRLLQSLQHSITIDNELIDFTKTVVIVGRDTRPHSGRLLACIKLGVEILGGTLIDVGVVTTPQLHFSVGLYNEQSITDIHAHLITGEWLISQYNERFSKAYVDICSRLPASENKVHLIIDASNGVGSLSISRTLDRINTLASASDIPHSITYDIRNPAYSGPVNHNCGAEHVQKNVQPPVNVSAGTDIGHTICSLDGDADRIVFHGFVNKGHNSDPSAGSDWIMLDGDKIAALFVILLKQTLEAAEPLLHSTSTTTSTTTATTSISHTNIRFGVVQTAYANGSSTSFFRSQGVDVSMAKTGVKYLHHVALEKYDIGVYFEANGHGKRIICIVCIVFIWCPLMLQAMLIHMHTIQLYAYTFMLYSHVVVIILPT